MSRIARWGAVAILMGCAESVAVVGSTDEEEPIDAGDVRPDAGQEPDGQPGAGEPVDDAGGDEIDSGSDSGESLDAGDDGAADAAGGDAGLVDAGDVDAGPCVLSVSAPDSVSWTARARYPKGDGTTSIPYPCPTYLDYTVCRNHLVAAGAKETSPGQYTIYPAPGACRIAVPVGCLPCTSGVTEW